MPSKLNVSDALKNPGQSFPFNADCEIEEMEIFGDSVLLTDVTCKGTMVGGIDTVGFEGEADATVTTRCARCRDEIVRPLHAQVDAVYSRVPDPEDPDLYSFEAYTVDLTDAIRDALVLELPMRFLCSEDCKGLCPKCGTNLNTGTCTCQEGVDDSNPFAALRSIVVNNEEV